MYIRTSDNCLQGEPCWTKVVGTISDGDNPFYVSALDQNKDGVINNMDIKVAQQNN